MKYLILLLATMLVCSGCSSEPQPAPVPTYAPVTQPAPIAAPTPVPVANLAPIAPAPVARTRPNLVGFEVVVNEDTNNPAVTKRSRSLLVKKGLNKDQVRDLLVWYYHDMWVELQAAASTHKGVWIHVYDQKSKINMGLGEWIGMISANGLVLPEWPEPKLMVPDYKNAPTKREEKIHDALQKALFASDEPEEVIERRIAKKFKISTKELDRIFLKVTVHRQGG